MYVYIYTYIFPTATRIKGDLVQACYNSPRNVESSEGLNFAPRPKPASAQVANVHSTSGEFQKMPLMM